MCNQKCNADRYTMCPAIKGRSYINEMSKETAFLGLLRPISTKYICHVGDEGDVYVSFCLR